MHLILLPGNAPCNEPWIRQVEQQLRPHFHSIEVLTYDHWRTGEPIINIDQEVAKLQKCTQSHSEYIIFAKSAGVLVTTKAMSEHKISPQQCIFIGVPLDWAKSNNFNIPKWIKSVNAPTLVIQHLCDPLATFSQVAAMSRSYHLLLKQLPGDDHFYQELDIIIQLVIDFIHSD
jgi:predicted alpha/beta-hydrolase family hydrolase